MTNHAQQPEVRDPDSVPETFCDGQFNVSISGQFATITFTHIRPEAGPMFADGTINLAAVVRARIVMTVPNLVALRDLLNRVITEPEVPAPAAGGPTRH